MNIKVYIMEICYKSVDHSPDVESTVRMSDSAGPRNVKEGYNSPPRTTAPMPAARVSSHFVESRNPVGVAALTVGPVRFEAAVLPHIWKLRK